MACRRAEVLEIYLICEYDQVSGFKIPLAKTLASLSNICAHWSFREMTTTEQIHEMTVVKRTLVIASFFNKSPFCIIAPTLCLVYI